jgi:hypothetical protein
MDWYWSKSLPEPHTMYPTSLGGVVYFKWKRFYYLTAFCFRWRAWFAFRFLCRQVLQVKKRPKSIRGFFWLQEEQNWSIGIESPVESLVGSPVESPVGLPIGSSQPSLPPCRPSQASLSPAESSCALYKLSQASLSPGKPPQPSCCSIKLSPPSVEPSQASLTPAESSRSLCGPF